MRPSLLQTLSCQNIYYNSPMGHEHVIQYNKHIREVLPKVFLSLNKLSLSGSSGSLDKKPLSTTQVVTGTWGVDWWPIRDAFGLLVLYLLHTLTHLLGCMSETEEVGLKERHYYYRGIIFMFLGFTFGVDSISEEVSGFSPFMVSLSKNTVFIVSCV